MLVPKVCVVGKGSDSRPRRGVRTSGGLAPTRPAEAVVVTMSTQLKRGNVSVAIQSFEVECVGAWDVHTRCCCEFARQDHTIRRVDERSRVLRAGETQALWRIMSSFSPHQPRARASPVLATCRRLHATHGTGCGHCIFEACMRTRCVWLSSATRVTQRWPAGCGWGRPPESLAKATALCAHNTCTTLRVNACLMGVREPSSSKPWVGVAVLCHTTILTCSSAADQLHL